MADPTPTTRAFSFWRFLRNLIFLAVFLTIFVIIGLPLLKFGAAWLEANLPQIANGNQTATAQVVDPYPLVTDAVQMPNDGRVCRSGDLRWKWKGRTDWCTKPQPAGAVLVFNKATQHLAWKE